MQVLKNVSYTTHSSIKPGGGVRISEGMRLVDAASSSTFFGFSASGRDLHGYDPSGLTRFELPFA